jgi:hydrogenase expression/formation protein HypC
MCLAIPAKVVSADPAGETAIVALGPVKKEISIALLDNVAIGDFVLVHVGFALHKLSPSEAERTLAMIREAGGESELEAFAGEAAA